MAALAAARKAHSAASEALNKAEAAARLAGMSVDSDPGGEVVQAPAEELRVQRIRIVEPDGTTRMIIGNSTASAVAPIRGQDEPHPGRGEFAGIIFCNDEGTEAGGLVYARWSCRRRTAPAGILDRR
ncbi:hypothetical protein [Microlunatus elymi]|nr:hypothetical protein [Microlunatus elymi]